MMCSSTSTSSRLWRNRSTRSTLRSVKTTWWSLFWELLVSSISSGSWRWSHVLTHHCGNSWPLGCYTRTRSARRKVSRSMEPRMVKRSWQAIRPSAKKGGRRSRSALNTSVLTKGIRSSRVLWEFARTRSGRCRNEQASLRSSTNPASICFQLVGCDAVSTMNTRSGLLYLWFFQ